MQSIQSIKWKHTDFPLKKKVQVPYIYIYIYIYILVYMEVNIRNESNSMEKIEKQSNPKVINLS